MTNPLPKPPPCPPDPWPMIGKAWNEMQAFREMLWQVLLDMSMTDPRFTALLQDLIVRNLMTDPRITNLLQTMISQEIGHSITSDQMVISQLTALINEVLANQIGVTDGSNAAAGHIGEFMTNDIAVPFGPYPAVTDTTVPLITIPAGDWDMRMNMDTSTGGPTPVPVAVGAFSSWIDSPPAGLSNQLTMVQYPFVAGMTADSIVALNSCVARGSFAQSTPLSVRVVVNQASDPMLLGGQVFMHLEARRMR